MGDINFMDLTVEDIKIENGRVAIKADGNYYSFFQTKRDGQTSRAQQDFEKLGVEAGKTYSFGITENAKTGEDGKTVVFRNICVISETRAPKSSEGHGGDENFPADDSQA
ncbi:MAG: hypothetical protein PHH24_02820 [Candidatus Moranbacteria bacterium]|nr:hypothetical protein [Candidatus Moranbacteria bacterium]MDX9855740.1 hypothetical protein [Candidatus Moranbacteria bacterium]